MASGVNLNSSCLKALFIRMLSRINKVRHRSVVRNSKRNDKTHLNHVVIFFHMTVTRCARWAAAVLIHTSKTSFKKNKKKRWTINFDNYRFGFSFIFIVRCLVCSLNFIFLTFYFCNLVALFLFSLFYLACAREGENFVDFFNVCFICSTFGCLVEVKYGS